MDHFAAARVGVGAHACSLKRGWVGAVLLMLNPTPGMLVAGRLLAR